LRLDPRRHSGMSTATAAGMDRHDPDMPEVRLQAFENGQDIRDRTYRFACRVVELCKTLQGAGAIARAQVPQLLASATSVAANLEEARAAESTPDFISKCCISLKECRETLVRLKVVDNCNIAPRHELRALCMEAGELVAIIGAIVRNTKRNAADKAKRSKNRTNS
jgi:four helix bundle protein